MRLTFAPARPMRPDLGPAAADPPRNFARCADKTEALETGEREQRRVIVAPAHFLEACRDVAADVEQLQVGPASEDLCPAAHRRCADAGATRQHVERPAGRRHQHVAGVFALVPRRW